MKCKEGDILHTYDFDGDFHILESGNASRKGRRYPRGEYCIEVGCLVRYQIFVDIALKVVSAFYSSSAYRKKRIS